MGFRGSNDEKFPEFRMLRICGAIEEKVKLAHEHVEREYVQKAERVGLEQNYVSSNSILIYNFFP